MVVSEYLETNAAGDIARWPDRHNGESIRVEHWMVAERQGRAAAHATLRIGDRYDSVPFFWGQHYDFPINYVGHASDWDALDIEGDVRALATAWFGIARVRKSTPWPRSIAASTIWSRRSRWNLG